jgi:O-antigen/teichoic acid export membrane protein
MLKQKLSVESLVRLSFSLLFTVSIITSLVSFFYSREVMAWLYPIHEIEPVANYTGRLGQSALIFSLLMFSFIAIASSYVFGTLLTANGNMKQLNIIAGGSVLLSLLINFILVPEMQATGSAFASLASQFLTAIAQVIVAQRIFRFRINYRFLLTLMVFAAAVVFLGLLTMRLPFEWKINLLLMLIGSAFLIPVLRLIQIKELIRILRSEQE